MMCEEGGRMEEKMVGIKELSSNMKKRHDKDDKLRNGRKKLWVERRLRRMESDEWGKKGRKTRRGEKRECRGENKVEEEGKDETNERSRRVCGRQEQEKMKGVKERSGGRKVGIKERKNGEKESVCCVYGWAISKKAY